MNEIQRMNEDTLVQQTTADYIYDNLDWDESIYAMDEVYGKEGTLGRESERDVILTRYLGTKLIDFNPGLPLEAYRDAMKRVSDYSSTQSLVVTNKEKDSILRNGVEVIYRNEKGERVKKRLRLFDFIHPENNHFLVVREFWIKGEIYRRRADIMGFVNGIPLLFMEVKNVNKNLKEAYERNLADYRDTVPHLLHHNAIIILGNGIEAKIGSITSKFEHFAEWKRLSESDPGVVDMETLLKGVCSKVNLLDIFENYIVFDESGERTVKIVARNHQFLGVNRAIDSVKERKERDGKLGVFWHTQGSGKSYSMAFFTRKIHRKLGGNFTFLVLTDREDLDTQIYKTFAGCGLADHDKEPCRASSGEHLMNLLGQQKSYIFSLIQKFNKEVIPGNPYTSRDDIIVITDEAHRTQNGSLSLNVRNALPNASFIGFTGTPLFKDDEITKRIFGDYISTYDFQRAVEDGATVPLYYDARGEKLGVATTDINEKIAQKLEELEISDINIEQRLEKELKRDYHIITAQKRLEHIANDFVEHYTEAWESGKAMLVCIDKITCVRMYELIMQKWQERIEFLERDIKNSIDDQDEIFRSRQIEWMRETRISVVVSEEQGEVEKFRNWGFDITPHRKLIKEGFPIDDGKRIGIESAFKSDSHPFRVAIVCAMWLTGFDVPTLSTLYLDKPLKAHTLMQAIARANRVSEGKTNGLVVDYCGILKNLQNALATFAGRGDKGRGGKDDKEDPAKKSERLLKQLEESINHVRTFFNEKKYNLNEIIKSKGFERNAAIMRAKNIVNENDRTRKKFEILARDVFVSFKAAINERPKINDYRADKDAINIIYTSLQKDREDADISSIMQELQVIVDNSIDIKSELVRDTNIYDISKIDFDRLHKEFEKRLNKNTIVQNIRIAIDKRLDRMMKQNPQRADFQKHYEEIIKEYNREKDRVTIEKTFEELMKFVKRMDEEEERAMREGLDKETLVLFDLLKKPDLTANDISKLKKVAAELLETLKKEKLKIDNWREKEATRDAVKQAIFDFLYDENTGLPVKIYTDDDINHATEEIFQHVYRVYSKLPSPVYAD